MEISVYKNHLSLYHKGNTKEVMIMEKKLYRIEEGKIICGVCGGIAEYFNIDPTLVRLGFVLLSAAGGSALLVYIVGAIIMPVKPMQLP